MTTADEIIAFFRMPEGRTSREAAEFFGIKLTDMASRISKLVVRDRLFRVQRTFGGSPRYYGDWDAAQQARINNRITASCPTVVPAAIHNDRQSMRMPSASPAVKLPTGAKDALDGRMTPVVIGRTGTDSRIDRMAGQCPADARLSIRPGAMDFKSIPSLSPFSKGAVR